MAALESVAIAFFDLSYSPNLPVQSPAGSKLPVRFFTTKLSHKSHPPSLPISRKFQVFSSSSAAIQGEVSVEEKEEEKLEKTQQEILKRRVFVLNLPWSFSVDDLKNLFSECGTVEDVEIIKRKRDGKSRGYAFATMASREEALAVIEKYDSHELMGRIIRVEFTKDIKKSSPPPPPPPPPPREKRYKLYVSNLAWKVRSIDLREFFAAGFNPISTRVVFESPLGRSAGYGFVTFVSKEEAKSAVSALNGKELFGRPITLAFSERNADKTETKENTSDKQPAES